MDHPAAPETVQHILRNFVDSYEKLYTLVALFRRSTGASADQLATQLGLAESTVVEALTELKKQAVITTGPTPDRFVYVTGNPARDEGLTWLAEQLEAGGVELVRVLNEAALSRVRDTLYMCLSPPLRRIRRD
jgi:predicted RecB family endonuclease